MLWCVRAEDALAAAAAVAVASDKMRSVTLSVSCCLIYLLLMDVCCWPVSSRFGSFLAVRARVCAGAARSRG